MPGTAMGSMARNWNPVRAARKPPGLLHEVGAHEDDHRPDDGGKEPSRIEL